ncbi:hypothetical protein AHF37_03009 [Paragonimus kellicotti]|nr:hypothetical protein AHF37_03009 [Paragonimus kellicotti]
MNKTQLWGRIIKVDFSRSFPKTSREMALRSSLSSSTTSVAGLLAAPFPSVSVPRVTSPRLIVSGNSRCSSRSVSFKYWRKRRECSSESSSSSSRSSCSCRRRSQRSRKHSSSSYRSRSRSSGSVTYRKVIYNGTGSPAPKSIYRSRYFPRIPFSPPALPCFHISTPDPASADETGDDIHVKPITVTDSSVRKRVMRQVEFYLSAGNLCRDQFFSREMKKRSDGGIPIELLLQCHRLQAMQVTKDILIRAVKKSSLIKLSDDGEAIVRTCPLPELSVPREKRTVLVCGIPRWIKEPEPKEDFVLPNSDMRTPSESVVYEHENSRWEMMDWLREIFSEFGEVLYINLPHYHSSGIFRGFAFVEFSSSKDAKAASKAMRPKPEHEIWFVPPISQEMANGVNAVHENAWKPRLAAKTSFCPGDMLARRYVWRTCSRKNKQIQTAFRQLRASGYRATNPCDREYELITLGESSAEARSKYLRESYGEPRREKLRVFRYSTWEFWRSKFYVWLHAWVVRMNKKTEELSLEPQSDLMDTTNGDLTNFVNRDEPSISIERPTESVPNISATTACADHSVILPKNFVHTTVVLLYWPSSLVPAAEQFVHSPKESDELFPVCKPHLSLARRIRISVEHHLLSACNLLEEVAHLDPTPSEAILTEVISALGTSVVLSTTDYPVFIRMKTKPSACELCRFIEEAHASDTPSSASISSVRVHLLFGLSELAYCRALSTSLVGANERRRRAQLSRRLRKKAEQHCQSSHNSDPLVSDLSSGQMSTPSSDAQLRHILFDE